MPRCFGTNLKGERCCMTPKAHHLCPKHDEQPRCDIDGCDFFANPSLKSDRPSACFEHQPIRNISHDAETGNETSEQPSSSNAEQLDEESISRKRHRSDHDIIEEADRIRFQFEQVQKKLVARKATTKVAQQERDKHLKSIGELQEKLERQQKEFQDKLTQISQTYIHSSRVQVLKSSLISMADVAQKYRMEMQDLKIRLAETTRVANTTVHEASTFLSAEKSEQLRADFDSAARDPQADLGSLVNDLFKDINI